MSEPSVSSIRRLSLHVVVEDWREVAYTAARVSDIYAFHTKQQDLNQQFVVIADG